MEDFSALEHRIEISHLERGHTLDEAIAVIESGRIVSDDPSTALSPQDEFIYRHSFAHNHYKGKELGRLGHFLLSMYGRAYLEAPELTEAFYKDVEIQAQHVGEIALFANLHHESGASAVTIGFLGDTSRYPEHIRRSSAQSANYQNTLGLVGLTRIRLETYQRVAKDPGQEVDLMRSIVTNTFRFYPFVAERIKMYNDMRTVVERRDIRVGEKEIKKWAEAHPEWEKYVIGTLRAVQVGAPNPILDFWVPDGVTDLKGAVGNLAAFENLLDFERDDDL